MRTDSGGNAKIAIRFGHAGTRLATLSPPGGKKTVAKASVTVLPAPDRDRDR
jgi:hypothetical protein